MDEWQIEALGQKHQRESFTCGKAILDNFLHLLVNQYEKRNLGRTYVAVRIGDQQIRGYYTLAAGAITFENLPAKAAKKLPKHTIPVALLGRLAVDLSVQRTGLGRLLLGDALKRCLNLSGQLGIYGVEVDALDEQAKTFYARFGFAPLLDNPMHLYLPITAIEKAFRKGDKPHPS